MTAVALDPVRLVLPHLLHLRAVAQGLPVAEAARRYLGVEHGNEAPAAHRRVVDRVAAVARRRGDSRWRLLGVEIAVPAAPESRPAIDDWARDQGLEDWPNGELQDLYAERFPPPEPAEQRRQARNARLRARRLARITELEAVAAERALPSDRLDGWLSPELAGQLQRRGLLLLGDLQALIARGGRWWKGLPAYGPVKAARLAGRVEQLLGAPRPPWAPAAVQADLAALSGREGANRAPAAAAGIDAADDRQAVQAWIAARAGSALTARQYEREAERFILWCVIERGRALADATAEDCRGDMDFIADVPPRWISRAKAARFAPGWAPFRGPLSVASQGVAIAALHSLFSWLVQARYLASNPWVLVNRKLGDDPARGDDDDATSRAFTPAAWRALQAHLQGGAASASTAWLAWLCTFVECTGLRAAELLGARRAHLQRGAHGWVLRVHGKGRRNRTVPVPTAAIDATRRYFAARGMELESAPPETPLLALLVDPTAAISYGALHETFTRFVRRAVKAGDLTDEDRRHAERASAHWLRHTHATRAAERNVPPDGLQENLGQSDPRTTARYYRAQMQRRQKEMERAFAETADLP